MWTKEVPKKTKFRIVIEADYSADDKVSEETCAKIVQRIFDEHNPRPGKIHPLNLQVIQVYEEQ